VTQGESDLTGDWGDDNWMVRDEGVNLTTERSSEIENKPPWMFAREDQETFPTSTFTIKGKKTGLQHSYCSPIHSTLPT
jgi:hypothetical protein